MIVTKRSFLRSLLGAPAIVAAASLMPVPQFETVEIPFVRIGNRRGLTGMQLAQEPWLADFVRRFPHSFEYGSPNMDVVFFIEPESAPL